MFAAGFKQTQIKLQHAKFISSKIVICMLASNDFLPYLVQFTWHISYLTNTFNLFYGMLLLALWCTIFTLIITKLAVSVIPNNI